ncbi:MAG TPA: tetratricopeptide repeat protein [Candidatus Eisenbacteria bacterium]|nr:tetratricopeptide repeat protein [Candidatus Eisenbacteria bacterium]
MTSATLATGMHAALDQAASLLREGRFDEAVEAFSACILKEQGVAEAHYGRARAYFFLQKWDRARADYARTRELSPEILDGWVGEGICLAMEGAVYDAFAVFEKLLEANPGYTRGHIQLGILYYKLGLIPKGHRQMETALESRPAPSERRQILQFLKEQKALDKRRHYKPDFEALRKENQTSEGGWMKSLRKLFGRKPA